MTPLLATIMAFTFAVQTLTNRAQMATQRNLRVTDKLLAELEPDFRPRRPYASKATFRYLCVMAFVLPFLTVVFASAAITGFVAQ